MLPPILNDLVGKTFLFKIAIERENYLYKHPTFKVLKIMTNTRLINDFDAIASPMVVVLIYIFLYYIAFNLISLFNYFY